MKRYWNKFLNWLIPGRTARILTRMMKMDQEAGLYDEPKCCGHWDEFGRCNCEKPMK